MSSTIGKISITYKHKKGLPIAAPFCLKNKLLNLNILHFNINSVAFKIFYLIHSTLVLEAYISRVTIKKIKPLLVFILGHIATISVVNINLFFLIL